MNTHNSNPDETLNNGHHLEDFKRDQVDVEGILGGGKGAVILPTIDDGSGINDSGFTSDSDLDSDSSAANDGTVGNPDDGTVQPLIP